MAKSEVRWFDDAQPRVCHVCGLRVTLRDGFFQEHPVMRSFHASCRAKRREGKAA